MKTSRTSRIALAVLALVVLLPSHAIGEKKEENNDGWLPYDGFVLGETASGWGKIGFFREKSKSLEKEDRKFVNDPNLTPHGVVTGNCKDKRLGSMRNSGITIWMINSQWVKGKGYYYLPPGEHELVVSVQTPQVVSKEMLVVRLTVKKGHEHALTFDYEKRFMRKGRWGLEAYYRPIPVETKK